MVRLNKSKNALSDTCLWVLLGATSVGKTEISIAFAEKLSEECGLEAEIVSIDSMQVYKRMDIGTAKVSEADRARVAHHMLDVVEPSESFNAAKFCRMAYVALKEIRKKGKQPLLICGTPFYLKALLWGMFDGPDAQPEIRRRLRSEWKSYGVTYLHERLRSVDPRAAENINENDYKRIERALEVYEVTGEPISEQQVNFDGPPKFETKFVSLTRPREILYARIENRVEQMFESGLVDEVMGLRSDLGKQASQAVGYKEILACLEGEIALDEAKELIKRNTRHFAKDQIGWFKRFPVSGTIELGDSVYSSDQLTEMESHFTRG